jgi:hypothetical protein
VLDPKRLKTQLQTLPTRAAHRADTERWGKNELPGLPEDILPDISETVRGTINRLASTCQSVGPRIINTIKFGTLGDVNWGGKDTSTDALIETRDLEGLAEEILENALYSGVMEGIVRRGEDGIVRIEPLVGYTEPVYAPDSPSEVAGYIHAWLDASGGDTDPKWTLRVYDLAARTMHEQRGLTEPARFDLQRATPLGPTDEYPAGSPIPTFLIVGKGRNRMPRGYLADLLPLIKGDWVSQLRGDRTEEATAFPQLVLKGSITDGTTQRSATHVLTVADDGDAHFLLPGDLSQMHAHHDRKLERLREDASMPGGFLGSDSPSGEALREANAKFINLCKWYAARLSRVLTALCDAYAEAEGVASPGHVVVSINREFEKDTEAQRIVSLYTEGLVEFGAAVRAISAFVPTWEPKAIEAFVSAKAAPPPEGGEA